MFNALRPLLVVLAIAYCLPAQAQDEARDGTSERENAGDRVRQVERDGGRVLQAEPMQRSGREVYRLKVLTPEGRVRVLDDSRRGEPRQESFERRRSGRDDPERSMPPSERSSSGPEARPEPPPQRRESSGLDSGGDKRPPSN